MSQKLNKNPKTNRDVFSKLLKIIASGAVALTTTQMRRYFSQTIVKR